jgi:lipopolysaccharide export system ATP-binding protein
MRKKLIPPDNLFLQIMSLTIQTKELVKVYGSRTVVNKVSFNVQQGEIVGLLGPNGAGKTTSFYQVVGLVKPDEGEVFLGDLNITRLPMYKRAQMGIGYLPQEASVFRKLNVEDNLKAVLEMTKLSKLEQKEKLEILLDEFRLAHVRKNNGDTLSGGERRRTEIARSLAVDPKFILLDEPFAGVDPIAVEDIQEIIAKLKYKNIGILITDHNVNETLSICDRAYLLIDGKIFKHGTAEELAADEQVRRLYLGRNFELKRKDYLHLEAAKNRVSLDALIHKVQNALSGLENLELGRNKRFYSADTTPDILENDIIEENLQLNEYRQFLEGLKSSVYKFANESNNPGLLNNVQDIYADQTLETTTALNRLLFELKSALTI